MPKATMIASGRRCGMRWTPNALTADALQMLARRRKVCPFELGLDLSLWCDVVIGDYNYLFDPVVHLERFLTAGDYLFLLDEANIIFRTAPGACTVPSLPKAPSTTPKAAGQGQKQPEKRTDKGQRHLHRVAATAARKSPGDSRFGRTFFEKSRADALDRALTRAPVEPLEIWLDEHRDPDETHEALLQLYFDIRAWLRVADIRRSLCICKSLPTAVRSMPQCSAWTRVTFWRRTLPRAARRCCSARRWLRQAITRDLCGLPDARAVALRQPV